MSTGATPGEGSPQAAGSTWIPGDAADQPGAMRDVDEVIAALPDPFTTAAARAFGISDDVLARLDRSGRVRRVARGIYRQVEMGAPPDDWGAVARDHLARARVALEAHPTHVLSHRTAALALGLPVRLHPDMPVDLTAITVQPRSRRVADRFLHHSDSLVNEVVVKGEWRLLPVERVVADCLRTLPTPSSVAIADAAVRDGLTPLDSVRETLEMQRRWVGRPRGLAAMRLIDPRRESWLESFSFVTLTTYGIPLPEAQVEVYDGRGRFVGRVDGMWIERGTVAEADGRSKYLLEADANAGAAPATVNERIVAEKCREDALRALGLEVVRWDTEAITRVPEAVADRVRDVWQRGDIRRFTGRLQVRRWPAARRSEHPLAGEFGHQDPPNAG